MLCGLACASARASFTTPARSAFFIDPASGMTLVNKEADALMPPSSMLKLMTLAMIFDAVKDGALSLDQRLPVSGNADHRRPVWAPASKLCLERGQEVSVRDIIMGLIVMSGGDAGVVAAEHLAGSEIDMAARMTLRAREIGMERSTFGNVSGLFHPDNLMTSRELAVLAQYLINEHPDFFPWFAERRFEFEGYEGDWCREWGRLRARTYNRLLFQMPGAEGLKTGRTSEGGFGMVAVARRGDRRLIGVINGLMQAKDHNALAREARRLLEYGFDTTENRTFFNPGDVVVQIPAWYGRRRTINATVENPFVVTLPRGKGTAGLRILARYYDPTVTTVRAGDKVGEIIAEFEGRVVKRAPLVARERVGRVIFYGRIAKNLQVIFRGR